MTDWPRLQEYNQLTVHTAAINACVGVELSVTGGQPASTAFPTANTALCIPFVMNQEYTVVKMACYNGATVSGNIDMGIYDTEGNRIASAGSTAQAGVSALQALAVSATFTPGVYFMALACSNTTSTFRGWTGGGGINAFMGILGISAFPLPNPATFVTLGTKTNFAPAMMLTSRSLI